MALEQPASVTAPAWASASRKRLRREKKGCMNGLRLPEFRERSLLASDCGRRWGKRWQRLARLSAPATACARFLPPPSRICDNYTGHDTPRPIRPARSRRPPDARGACRTGARHHAGRIAPWRPSGTGARTHPGGAAPHRRGDPRRHHRRAGRRQVHHHRHPRLQPDGGGTQGRGPRRRPLLAAQRRLHPRRQDAHGAARRGRERLHPPLPLLRHARRRRGESSRPSASASPRRRWPTSRISSSC